MRFRRILLMHPSRAFRGLIKKFLFAEFSDVEIIETDTAETALEQANNQRFCAMLASDLLNHQSTQHLMQRLKESRLNTRTPFIVLCERDSREISAHKFTEPYEHVVHIRLRPADLIRKLNDLCDPRQMREDDRYYLPDATMSINSSGLQTEARLINISRGGALVELATDCPELLMKNEITLRLQASTPSQVFDIQNLRGKLLRLNVADWQADNTPACMRVTFVFDELEPQTRNQLEALLSLAQNDDPHGEEFLQTNRR